MLEMLSGIVLLAVPLNVIKLLLEEDLQDPGAALGRILAIALIALGVATWQPASAQPNHAGRIGLFV